jgi:hypothetical protein
MKFTVVFLTGAALAQHAIVYFNDRPPMPVIPIPGECTILRGTSVKHAFTTPDIGLKFYTGYNCDGEQVATSSGENFKPTGDFKNSVSVKAVLQEELAKEASYYIYWGRY